MLRQLNDSDQESRTASIGSKRRARTENEGEISSGTSTPKKLKSNQSSSHGRPSPKGGSLSALSALPPQLSKSPSSNMFVQISDDSASSRESSATPAVPAMNWNSGANNVIRTSLRGQGASGKLNPSSADAPLPQAPIGLGNDDQNSEIGSTTSSDDLDGGDQETRRRSASVVSIDDDDVAAASGNDPVSISDDSEVESGDDSGIMLNMETQNGQDSSQSPLDISDDDRAGFESGEIESTDEESKVSANGPAQGHGDISPAIDATDQAAHSARGSQYAPLDGAAESKPTLLAKKGQRLGDLDSTELEHQLKYAYFHMKAEELDGGRLVICLLCFEEGHLAKDCSTHQCEHCGERDRHRSQFCPSYRRCLKCRERGHDKEHCTSKLKDTTIPCDFCQSFDHLEDSCPMIWIYAGPPLQGPVSLNISCANCASKTHLVGDCPTLPHPTQNKKSWSLQSLDPSQITNFALQPDRVRAEKILGDFGPKPGLRIRGQGDSRRNPNRQTDDYNDESEEDDDQFFRAPVNRARPGRHIRFDGGGPGKNRDNDQSYRPESSAYDPYQPDRQPYRDRRDEGRGPNPFDYTRPRSRSPPPFRSTRVTSGNGDRWQPPLPHGPPPSGAPGRRGRNKPAESSYRPLPSAGKKNWDRYRLGG